jgi:hypothetical protein
MMENDETLSKWKGNFYTTATLGFASQIIEMGLDKEVDDSMWSALVSDMAADAKRQIDKEGITEEIRKADFSELSTQSRTALNGHPLDVQRTPAQEHRGSEEDHPRMKAYNALLSVKEKYEE